MVIVANLAHDGQTQAGAPGMGSLDEAVKDSDRVEGERGTRIGYPQTAFPETDRQVAAVLVMPDGIEQKVIEEDICKIAVDRQVKPVEVLADNEVPVAERVFQLGQLFFDQR